MTHLTNHLTHFTSLSNKSGHIVSLFSYSPTCKRKPQLQAVAESRVPASPRSCVAIAAMMGWGSFQVSPQPLAEGFFQRLAIWSLHGEQQLS